LVFVFCVLNLFCHCKTIISLFNDYKRFRTFLIIGIGNRVFSILETSLFLRCFIRLISETRTVMITKWFWTVIFYTKYLKLKK
jgi:hypothetical protein